MWVAIDKENGQVFGPFNGPAGAVEYAEEVLVRTGEVAPGSFNGTTTAGVQDDLMDMGWEFHEVTLPALESFEEGHA